MPLVNPQNPCTAPAPHTSPVLSPKAVRTLACSHAFLSLNSPNARQKLFEFLAAPLRLSSLLPPHVNHQDRSKASSTFDHTPSTFLGHVATLLTPPTPRVQFSHSSVNVGSSILSWRLHRVNKPHVTRPNLWTDSITQAYQLRHQHQSPCLASWRRPPTP